MTPVGGHRWSRQLTSVSRARHSWSTRLRSHDASADESSCLGGTRWRPCPDHRHFGCTGPDTRRSPPSGGERQSTQGGRTSVRSAQPVEEEPDAARRLRFPTHHGRLARRLPASAGLHRAGSHAHFGERDLLSQTRRARVAALEPKHTSTWASAWRESKPIRGKQASSRWAISSEIFLQAQLTRARLRPRSD